MKLTENFSLHEFTDSATAVERRIDNTQPLYENPEHMANIRRLANYLQRIRNCYGRPMTISSGYRCEALNKAVGGAKNSQHTKGEACDIITGSRAENKRLFELIRKMGGYDQLIDEADYAWCHVSYRAGNNRGETLRMKNGLYYTA